MSKRRKQFMALLLSGILALQAPVFAAFPEDVVSLTEAEEIVVLEETFPEESEVPMVSVSAEEELPQEAEAAEDDIRTKEELPQESEVLPGWDAVIPEQTEDAVISMTDAEEDLFAEDGAELQAAEEELQEDSRSEGQIVMQNLAVQRQGYELLSFSFTVENCGKGVCHWLIQDRTETSYTEGNPPPKEAFSLNDQMDILSNEVSGSLLVDAVSLDLWLYVEDAGGNCSGMVCVHPDEVLPLKEAGIDRTSLRNMVFRLQSAREAYGSEIRYRFLKTSESAENVDPESFLSAGTLQTDTFELSPDDLISSVSDYPATEVSGLRCLVYLTKTYSDGKVLKSETLELCPTAWPVILPNSWTLTRNGENTYRLVCDTVNAVDPVKGTGYDVVLQHRYQYESGGTTVTTPVTAVLGQVSPNGSVDLTGDCPQETTKIKSASDGNYYDAEYVSTLLGIRFYQTGDSRAYSSPAYSVIVPLWTDAEDPGFGATVVEGLLDSYRQRDTMEVAVIGAGMPGSESCHEYQVVGDVRYRPISWSLYRYSGTSKSLVEGTWESFSPDASEYRIRYTFGDLLPIADYDLHLEFQSEQWDGTGWQPLEVLERNESFQLKVCMDNIVKLTSLTRVNNTLKLTWEKKEGIPRYRIFRRNGSGSWVKIGETADGTFTDKNVVTNTTYRYTVRGITADGKAYITSYDTKGLSLRFLAVPELQTVANTASGVKVTWKAAPGVTKYRVMRKYNGGSWLKVADTTGLSCVDRNVVSGRTYSYTIVGIRNDGSAYTSSYDRTGLTIRFLSTPGLVSARRTSAGTVVTWKKVTGAQGYIVYRKKGSEKSWTRVAAVRDGAAVNWKDTTATSSAVKYVYTVRAYYGSTRSSYVAGGITAR